MIKKQTAVKGYQAAYYDYINTLYPNRFSGPAEWQSCKESFRKLHDDGWFEEVLKHCQKTVLWTSKARLLACMRSMQQHAHMVGMVGSGGRL